MKEINDKKEFYKNCLEKEQEDHSKHEKQGKQEQYEKDEEKTSKFRVQKYTTKRRLKRRLKRRMQQIMKRRMRRRTRTPSDDDEVIGDLYSGYSCDDQRTTKDV